MSELVALCLVAYVVYDWQRRAKQRPGGAQVPAVARAAGVVRAPELVRAPMTIADLAIAYERAVLELDAVADETKTSALTWMAEIIVPLVGRLPIEALTQDLRDGVSDVLAEETVDDVEHVVYVWNDFVRWAWHQLRLNRAR